jgi:hypothetical protein
MLVVNEFLVWIQAIIVPELSERRRKLSCTFSSVWIKKLTELNIGSWYTNLLNYACLF